MLEAGMDLPTIQVLLGHASLDHTTVYLHLSRRHMDAVPNPLDTLAITTTAESRRDAPLASIIPGQGGTVQHSVSAYLQAGAPPEKLLVGIPFYGYCHAALNSRNMSWRVTMLHLNPGIRRVFCT
jgi:hypothetical protein